jgi:hypothetical protein
MKKLLNLTGHSVNVFLGGSEYLRIPPESKKCRIKIQRKVVGSVCGVPIRRRVVEAIDNLPAPMKDTVYIVPTIVLEQVRSERDDIVSPDSGFNAMKNKEGETIGVYGFVR